MMAHQATPMSRPRAIRPLGVLLTRIAHREARVAQLREAAMAPSVVQLEIEVLDSLKQEYTTRVARLNRYMGLC